MQFLEPNRQSRELLQRASAPGGLSETEAVARADAVVDQLEAEFEPELILKTNQMKMLLDAAEQAPASVLEEMAAELRQLTAAAWIASTQFGHAPAAELASVLIETLDRLAFHERTTRALCAMQIEALRLIVHGQARRAAETASRAVVVEARKALERLAQRRGPGDRPA